MSNLIVCTGSETCLMKCKCKVPHKKSDFCVDLGGRDLTVSCVHSKHTHDQYEEHHHVGTIMDDDALKEMNLMIKKGMDEKEAEAYALIALDDTLSLTEKRYNRQLYRERLINEKYITKG